MAEYSNQKSIIKQNLVDAGCQKDLTSRCMLLWNDNDFEQLNSVLLNYRKSLLNNLHEVNRKIDCLDYLLSRIEKMNNRRR